MSFETLEGCQEFEETVAYINVGKHCLRKTLATYKLGICQKITCNFTDFYSAQFYLATLYVKMYRTSIKEDHPSMKTNGCRKKKSQDDYQSSKTEGGLQVETISEPLLVFSQITTKGQAIIN